MKTNELANKCLIYIWKQTGFQNHASNIYVFHDCFKHVIKKHMNFYDLFNPCSPKRMNVYNCSKLVHKTCGFTWCLHNIRFKKYNRERARARSSPSANEDSESWPLNVKSLKPLCRLALRLRLAERRPALCF